MIDFFSLAENEFEMMVNLRRRLHMYPEVDRDLKGTVDVVEENLKRLGIRYRRIGNKGIIGEIGNGNGKTIALRADIDALEITEKSEIPYKSQNVGVMHACGHDCHAAMLLGAAKVLNEIKDELNGTVKLMFQPGEEVAQGAKRMIEDGALDGVDEVFGMHVMGNFPTGKIAIGSGALMASCDMFKITVKGKGGHGSTPHLGIDAVLAASAVVMNLQSIASREISPMDTVVISVGKFISGTRFNIIADEAALEGTTRCFSYEIRENLPKMIERIAKSTAESFRAVAELEYNFLTAPTINDEISTERARKSIEKIMSKDAIEEFPKMAGSEDFSEYLAKVPGTFAIVGTANEEKDTCYVNHHAKFNVDEDMLEHGVALHAQYAVDFLNEL